jgi:hypothetical protein
MTNRISISRHKLSRGKSTKFAWYYSYTVHSPDEYDASTDTLYEAQQIAKRRKRKTGFTIVEMWR